MAFQIAAIMQPGERVGDRHFERVLHIIAQLLGVAPAADLGAHPRQQFVLVDRAHQIVVDADLEATQQPRIAIGLGDRHDRHMPGAIQRARLTAQPQAVILLESERHDQQIVIALGGLKQRILGPRFQIDVMLGGEQRHQPLIGRRPVIDQQDAAALAAFGDGVALRLLRADLERGDGAHPQLIGHHLEPGQRPHPRDQHHVGHRLGEEIIGARFQPAHAVGRRIERGHHHHRNEMGRRIGLQPAAHLKAVHLRHHHVEQNQIAFRTRAGLQGLGAVGGGDDVEILSSQPCFQQPGIGGNIIDHEDTGGHAPSYPMKRRTVSMNLPTEIGLDR